MIINIHESMFFTLLFKIVYLFVINFILSIMHTYKYNIYNFVYFQIDAGSQWN